jgi:hypothetical protein
MQHQELRLFSADTASFLQNVLLQEISSISWSFGTLEIAEPITIANALDHDRKEEFPFLKKGGNKVGVDRKGTLEDKTAYGARHSIHQ